MCKQAMRAFDVPTPIEIGRDSIGTPYGPSCPNGCLAEPYATAESPDAYRMLCFRCDAEWLEMKPATED